MRDSIARISDSVVSRRKSDFIALIERGGALSEISQAALLHHASRRYFVVRRVEQVVEVRVANSSTRAAAGGVTRR